MAKPAKAIRKAQTQDGTALGVSEPLMINDSEVSLP